jgi:hypothetical protein
MAEVTNRNQRNLVVDGLPPCSIYAAGDGTWHVLAQLAADAQAALAAAAPTPDDLCQRAQHALGLAGIGSRIDRAYTAVGIYADRSGARFGEPALVLDGPAVLWWVAHASSAAIHALVTAATQAMRTAPDL